MVMVMTVMMVLMKVHFPMELMVQISACPTNCAKTEATHDEDCEGHVE